MSKIEYEEIITFHPGYYISEIIEDMETTQSEFAKRLNTTDKTLSKLLNGEIPLSNDMAQKLAQMLGTGVDVWLRLQMTYDQKVIEIKQKKELDEEKEYLKQIDYKYFSKLKLVDDTRDVNAKINSLRKYFKVASLGVLKEKNFLIACRSVVANMTEKNIINSNAWVQTALNFSESINCKPFNKKLLESYLNEIRSMTLQEPSTFYPRLREIFTECGVAFVVLPHLQNSGVNGAVKWINKDKVLLALNNRRLNADTFWFSLFHEIKHVLQQRIKSTFISGNAPDFNTETDLEDEADLFSMDKLIPREEYRQFLELNSLAQRNIESFSNRIGIHPGVVVGRLQYDGHIPYTHFTHMRIKYLIK